MSLRFIRRSELARVLGCDFTTTYSWEKSGKLPPATKLSRQIVGWPLSQLPAEWRHLFAEEPLRGPGGRARADGQAKVRRDALAVLEAAQRKAEAILSGQEG